MRQVKNISKDFKHGGRTDRLIKSHKESYLMNRRHNRP